VKAQRTEDDLDNVTLYSTKLRNPTQVATMATALDLGLNRRCEGKVLQRAGYYSL
jgi:hypothetical protein